MYICEKLITSPEIFSFFFAYSRSKYDLDRSFGTLDVSEFFENDGKSLILNSSWNALLYWLSPMSFVATLQSVSTGKIGEKKQVVHRLDHESVMVPAGNEIERDGFDAFEIPVASRHFAYSEKHRRDAFFPMRFPLDGDCRICFDASSTKRDVSLRYERGHLQSLRFSSEAGFLLSSNQRWIESQIRSALRMILTGVFRRKIRDGNNFKEVSPSMNRSLFRANGSYSDCSSSSPTVAPMAIIRMSERARSLSSALIDCIAAILLTISHSCSNDETFPFERFGDLRPVVLFLLRRSSVSSMSFPRPFSEFAASEIFASYWKSPGRCLAVSFARG